MSQTLCLQDWVTVTATAATTIVQPETGWQDVADFQDLAFYVEVASTLTGATLNIQGSPTKEEAFFNAKISAGTGNPYLATFPLSTGGVQTLGVIRWQTAALNQLPARWLRWQVVFTGAGNPTFRIWVSGNQAGRRWQARPGGVLVWRPSAPEPPVASRSTSVDTRWQVRQPSTTPVVVPAGMANPLVAVSLPPRLKR